jgi:hypothetical protein
VSETPITDALITSMQPEPNIVMRVTMLVAHAHRLETALAAALAAAQADRESWRQQSEDRVADCLRLGEERNAAMARCGEIDGLKKRIAELNLALDQSESDLRAEGQVSKTLQGLIDQQTYHTENAVKHAMEMREEVKRRDAVIETLIKNQDLACWREWLSAKLKEGA